MQPQDALGELSREPTRWSPVGPADRLCAGREKPGNPCRAGISQGPGRDPGRRLAACGLAFGGAKPGEQVVDLCAGAGGKTLALAATMQNKGQIYRDG